jgi:hypothetical protein
VLRSSVQTIDRYRAATEHLLRSWRDGRFRTPPSSTPAMTMDSYAICELSRRTATRTRPSGRLMDKGLRYVLECCRALFNYAAKRGTCCPTPRTRSTRWRSTGFRSRKPGRGVCLPASLRRLAVPALPYLDADSFAAGELTHLLLPEEPGPYVLLASVPKPGTAPVPLRFRLANALSGIGWRGRQRVRTATPRFQGAHCLAGADVV